MSEALKALEEAKELISGPAAWLDSWAQHVGNCKGGYVCTCGLTAARTEAAAAFAVIDTLRAALAPVPDAEIEAVRGRHEERMHFSTEPPPQIAADFATLLRAYDAMRAENERLREALRFYRDPLNYIGVADPRAGVYLETSPVEADGGQRARAALKDTSNG